MKRSVLILLCLLVTTNGCYFGRTRTTKNAGYVANGTAVVLGGFTLAATAASSSDSCSGASCAGAGIGAAGAVLIGATLVAIGGLGLLINAVVPLDATPVRSPAATGNATITTPGLPATQIELR